MKPLGPRRKHALVAGAALLIGLGGWWLLWHGLEAAAPSTTSPPDGPTALHEPTTARAEPPVERASDGVPIMAAGPSEHSSEEPRHPHPHTPIHDRIYRENTLYGQLNGAMDVKDVAGMRRLLQEYRDEYPEDAHYLHEGYAVIADCLEHPGEATRSAGERYWRDHRASLLRRYVRRHCLEATP